MITLSRNSWLYKIAKKSPTLYKQNNVITDICDLRKHFIRGLWEFIKDAISMLFAIGAIGLALVGYEYTTWKAIIYVWRFSGSISEFLIQMGGAQVFGTVINSMIVLGVLYWMTINKYRTYKYNQRNIVQKPTVLGEMYRSFKEKYCIKVELVD